MTRRTLPPSGAATILIKRLLHYDRTHLLCTLMLVLIQVILLVVLLRP